MEKQGGSVQVLKSIVEEAITSFPTDVFETIYTFISLFVLQAHQKVLDYLVGSVRGILNSIDF